MNELESNLYVELENKFIEFIISNFEVQRKEIRNFMRLTKKSAALIKKVYEDICQTTAIKYDELTIILEEDVCHIHIDNEYFQLVKDDLLRILVYLIDLYRPIHPLGTLVSLKKDQLLKLTNNQRLDEAKFIITKRFIFNKDANVYFTYAGVPYPIANLGLQHDFYFTDDLIDKVIYPGYCDDSEIAFVYMMKRELLIEKNYMSVGYASKEERDKLLSQT